MSQDGANIGVKPERALQSILGGKPSPEKDEQLSKEKMLAEIMAMPDSYKEAAKSYDTTSMWLAKQFYLLKKEGIDGDAHAIYDAMVKKCGKQNYDFTGFMVGWANNVSRWLLDQPEQENPAIVTIG